mgnify:CR=1 FL=1
MKCLLSATNTINERHRHGFKCVRCGREIFSRYADSNLVSVVCNEQPLTVVTSTTGPGTELKKLLTELGISSFNGCSCNERAAQMNRWGVEGCREHFDIIRCWIVDAQEKAGWATTITATIAATVNGLALRIDPTDVAGSLVRIAIERAENVALQS